MSDRYINYNLIKVNFMLNLNYCKLRIEKGEKRLQTIRKKKQENRILIFSEY